MFYDLIASIGQQASAEAAIAEIKRVFIPLGVRVNYDGEYVILCMNRGRINFRSPIQYECNGIVLGVANGTIRVLAIPPRALSTVYTANYLVSNLMDYEIIRAEDGTTLTMYHDDYSGQWRLASRTGFDVGDKIWGTRKYIDLVREFFDWDTVTAGLNKDYSYSFGFHHADCHPFNAPNRCWHVETRDRTTDTVITDADTNDTNSIDANGNTVRFFPRQERLSVNVTNFRGSRALFAKLFKENMESLIAGSHHGWILHRRRCGPDHNNDNILLESELAKFIRANCYDFPRVDSRNDVRWRMIYTTLRAYLKSNFWKFIEVFPQYRPVETFIRGELDNLAKSIASDSSNDDVGDITNTNNTSNINNTTSEKISPRAVFVANARKTLGADRKNTTVVKDYIESVNNLEILTGILTMV